MPIPAATAATALRSRRALPGALLALAALVAPALAAAGPPPATGKPAPAAAKTVLAGLRVEGTSGALEPGASYVTGSVAIATDTRPACGGSGKTVNVAGPTALGAVQDASEANRKLRPFGVSDKFDFGLLVCGIGNLVSSDTAFWLYKVNHKEATVGAGQYKLGPGDELLWYFSDTAANANTGAELELSAPVRAKQGDEVDVTVRAYDKNGKASPAEGATVTVDGEGEETTDPDGKVSLQLGGEAGTATLRATHEGDVAAAPVEVCVNDRPSRCPARRGKRIVGSDGADRLKGTAGWDEISARGGGDRIDVRGGGRDEVECGAGTDTVLADRRDRVAKDCEKRSPRA